MAEWWGELWTDVKAALRRARRTPGFSGVAALTVALAIGANAALFSVVYAVLLRPLPYGDPDRLLLVWTRHPSTDRYPFQLAEFCDYRDQATTIRSIAGYANWSPNLLSDQPAERLLGLRVTGNLFETLDVKAALGRTFTADDDRPGNQKVAVISHGTWQRRFGADAGVVGRSINLNGEPFTVVGVMGPEFIYPLRDIEIAVPLAPEADPWRQNRNTSHFIRAVARPKDGVTRAQVEAEFAGISDRLRGQYPDSYARKIGVTVTGAIEGLTTDFRATLWTLSAAVVVVLLIACSNLANLMLARALERRRELAVRRILGASGGSLVRQLTIDAAIVSGAGLALGLAIATWGVPGLVALSPTAMPRAREIQMSAPVAAFSAALAILSTVLFGLLPALRARRLDPVEDLRSGGRAGTGVAAGRVRRFLVVGQVALLAVLLVGAGLLMRSFEGVLRVAPGFDRGLLTMRLSLPRAAYPTTPRVSEFYRALELKVTALPGVKGVAAVNQFSLNGSIATADYKPADRPPADATKLPTAVYRMVTPAYFATMGIPLVSGRTFADTDGDGMPQVAIVSRSLARKSFESADPVGRQILVQDNAGGFRPLEIVGVASDVRHGGLEIEPEPHLYVPYHQTNASLLGFLTQNQFLVVRVEGGGASLAMSLADDVRRALRGVDPSVASSDVKPSDAYLDGAFAARRFALTLFGLFAGLALAMALLGLYGVVSRTVAERARETGVRIALGSSVGGIVRDVLVDASRLAILGASIGLVAAGLLARMVSNQLYGVTPADPATYATVLLALALTTLVASALPAVRAARVDPARALRQD